MTDDAHLENLKTDYNVTEAMQQKITAKMYTMCQKTWPTNFTLEVKHPLMPPSKR